MKVFTTEYIAEQRRRWGHRLEREWPLVSRIALRDERSDDRDRIEATFAALHADDRDRIATQLRNEKQFITTYNELVVARVLIHAGLKPRYERAIATASGYVTPDWFVEGDAPFLCDVFTAGLQKVRDEDETALRELEARLSEIPIGCMISFELPSASHADAGQRKRLAADVRAWLASAPPIGSPGH